MAKQRTSPVRAPQNPLFVSYKDERSQALAFEQATAAVCNSEPIVRTFGSDLYRNISPGNVSVRDSFTRSDYEFFRPAERRPVRPKNIIKACMDVYNEVGIVRNIIDLMGDFATQGVDLIHPNPRIEKFFKTWFKKVNGKERSERFLNMLYRAGNVIVKRGTAKLTIPQEEELRRGVASPDVKPEPLPSLDVREIPWSYTILNPTAIEVIAEELVPLIGSSAYRYALRVSDVIVKKIINPMSDGEKQVAAKLPAKIYKAIKKGAKVIPLDMNKIVAYYYKKDDWDVWAKPMTYAILDDINRLKKMKLADLAALDGVVSQIRVWKLGNLENKIMPSDTAVSRLATMLMNNVGGGVMDLIWTPDIELIETKTDAHHWLGQTKYEPVLNDIYAGLGVPPTLTGGGEKGFTNNFISLKTLTERLQYGRDLLIAFWEAEIRLVQVQMGFRFPAQVVFDRMTLTDENAEKQLLLHLADRGYISVETLQERFGETPEVEMLRIRREQRKREAGLMPPMASPFHDPQQDYGLRKVFAQTGVVTPSEVGLELEDRKSGQKSALDKKGDQLNKQAKLQGQNPAKTGGVAGQGRPKGSKDSGQRKQRTPKPRTTASFMEAMTWAIGAQEAINRIVTPKVLKAAGKENLRKLTDDETRGLEDLKFAALSQFEVGDEVTEQSVGAVMKGDTLCIPELMQRLLASTLSQYVEKNGRQPSVDNTRQFQAATYAAWKAA